MVPRFCWGCCRLCPPMFPPQVPEVENGGAGQTSKDSEDVAPGPFQGDFVHEEEENTPDQGENEKPVLQLYLFPEEP